MSAKDSISQFRSQLLNDWEQDLKLHSIDKHSIIDCSQCSHQLTVSEVEYLINFVSDCCLSINADPFQVMVKMLACCDKHQICKGMVTKEELIEFINMWQRDGQPIVAGLPD